ncbi:ACT domain-containing protein [Methanococcoides sp. SA1]|nr:ACT domain-containing protein [Methanococcoides sp. SA1]
MENKKFVISVMSKDRPGIISDVTTVIYDLGGDLDDLNQSVLGGYFTMILIAEFDSCVTSEALLAGFSSIVSENALEAIVKEVKIELELGGQANLPSETFVVTAQGRNRKGLVKILGDFFYTRNINVLDLVTTAGETLYTMIFQVDLSHIVSMGDLREELDLLGITEGLELVLQHNDIYMATNEVGMTLDTIIGD